MRRQTARVFVLVFLSASLSFAQTAPVNAGAAVPPVIRFSGTLAVAAGHIPVTFGLYRDETAASPSGLRRRPCGSTGRPLPGGAGHDHARCPPTVRQR